MLLGAAIVLVAACGGPYTATTVGPPGTAAQITVPTTVPTTVFDDDDPGIPDGETARVVWVFDGDTASVTVDGVEEHVRLVGINAPERDECLGAAATRRLEDLIGERDVTLVADVSDRDRYGRLLRYLWVDGLFVNETMVEEGLALAHRYEPDTALADRLAEAEKRARDGGLGLWAADACGPAVSVDVHIAAIRCNAPGDDAENPNGEWVAVENRDRVPVDLTGWEIKDTSASHRYIFPDGFSLDPGKTVTVHSGCGEDAGADLYWCDDESPVWSNSGDTAFLIGPGGGLVDDRDCEA